MTGHREILMTTKQMHDRLDEAYVQLTELRYSRQALGEFDVNAGTIKTILSLLNILFEAHKELSADLEKLTKSYKVSRK